MGDSQLITAEYEGKKRTLTVSEWSQLLKVSRKTLYARLKKGKVDDEFLRGISSKRKTTEQIEKEASRLSSCYADFNYSHGIVDMWRQKNGIR